MEKLIRRPLKSFVVYVRETIDVTYEIEAVNAEAARAKVSDATLSDDEDRTRCELERVDWEVGRVKELNF